MAFKRKKYTYKAVVKRGRVVAYVRRPKSQPLKKTA